MSTDNANAGTGNETVSQAETVENTQPSAGDMAALQPDATGAEQLQAPAGPGPEAGMNPAEADEMAGLHPDSPEDAANLAPEAESEEGNPAETDPADEAIEVALPDGFVVDEAAMGQFKDILKASESKQDMAQKLMDVHVAEQRKLLDSVQSRILGDAAKQNVEWAKQCRSDPDFGGEKYEESSNYVTKAILDHVPQEERGEFLRVFKAMRLNNQPHLRRFLARVGMAGSESAPVNSGGNGAPPPRTLADRMFPHIK